MEVKLNIQLREDLFIVKIGTNCILTPSKRNFRHGLISDVSNGVKKLVDLGFKVMIVSSAAIRHGERSLIMKEKNMSQQIYSMIGQSLMVETWRKPFNGVGLEVCSSVYVNRDLENPRRRRWTVKSLFDALDYGLIPILNEDDAKTTTEIKAIKGFGDNDHLASLLAVATKAGHLVMLTTVSGVICPFTNKLLSTIKATERKIQSGLIDWNGQSFGGMKSKVKYGKRVVKKIGNKTFIVSFRERDVLYRIAMGEKVGTKIIP